MRRLLFIAAAIAAACEATPGRTPIYPDALVREDAGFLDAVFPDARVFDGGFDDSDVALPDSGRPADYPFSGIFSILGDANKLYAREVRGRLHVVVGGHPYTYTGTITPEGNVDLTSAPLLRSGCPEARITGYYERPASVFFLNHVTCNSNGDRVEGMLRGGFDSDFNSIASGIYELRMTFVQSFQVPNCYLGPPDPGVLYWGVSVGPGNVVSVFTAHDVVAPTWFGGNGDQAGNFVGIEQLYTQPSGLDPSLRGAFLFGAAINDPVRIAIDRDYYDIARLCSWRMRVEGVRITSP